MSKQSVTLQIKGGDVGKGDELLLTKTQVNQLPKNAASGKGTNLTLSRTQIEKTAQRGGNIFSTIASLARPLVKPVLGALGSARAGSGRKFLGKAMGQKRSSCTNLPARIPLRRKNK